MEELGFMWNYQENLNELKQKLLCTIIELQALKFEAIEDMRKHKEDVNYLTNILKLACKERDEAKDQLQKILHNLLPYNPAVLCDILPGAQPGSPLVLPAKANSNTTESSSLSDTCNHQSRGSSPMDSFLDAVTSPDFTSVNMADSTQMGFENSAYVHEHHDALISAGLTPPAAGKIDPADAIINNLVQGKVLPRNGELLKAVMDAGPLLRTLLLAGPLPTWQNPPPAQPFKIPPVSISTCDASNGSGPNPTANASCDPKKPSISRSHVELDRGSPRMCSASMLNFDRDTSCSGLGNGLLSAISQIPAGKRQKLL